MKTAEQEIETRLKRIEEDLTGSKEVPGVFENLRQLQKLVKLSILVSLFGVGSNVIDWQVLVKIFNFL